MEELGKLIRIWMETEETLKDQIPLILNNLQSPDLKLNKNNVCRVCLSKGIIPIYEGSHSEQLIIAMECIGGVQLSPTDLLPKYLCLSCHASLQIGILFRKKAQDSDRLLRQVDTYSVKQVDYPNNMMTNEIAPDNITELPDNNMKKGTNNSNEISGNNETAINYSYNISKNKVELPKDNNTETEAKICVEETVVFLKLDHDHYADKITNTNHSDNGKNLATRKSNVSTIDDKLSTKNIFDKSNAETIAKSISPETEYDHNQVYEVDASAENDSDHPVNKDDASANKSDHPVKEDDIPAKINSNYTVNENDAPAENDSDHPVNKDDASANNSDHPVKEDDIPAKINSDYTVNENDAPAENDSDHPVNKGDASANKSDHPVKEDDIPAKINSDHPVNENDAPAENDSNHPVIKVDASAKNNSDHPVNENDASAKNNSDHPVNEAYVLAKNNSDHQVNENDASAKNNSDHLVNENDASAKNNAEHSVDEDNLSAKHNSDHLVNQDDTDHINNDLSTGLLLKNQLFNEPIKSKTDSTLIDNIVSKNCNIVKTAVKSLTTETTNLNKPPPRIKEVPDDVNSEKFIWKTIDVTIKKVKQNKSTLLSNTSTLKKSKSQNEKLKAKNNIFVFVKDASEESRTPAKLLKVCNRDVTEFKKRLSKIRSNAALTKINTPIDNDIPSVQQKLNKMKLALAKINKSTSKIQTKKINMHDVRKLAGSSQGQTKATDKNNVHMFVNDSNKMSSGEAKFIQVSDSNLPIFKKGLCLTSPTLTKINKLGDDVNEVQPMLLRENLVMNKNNAVSNILDNILNKSGESDANQALVKAIDNNKSITLINNSMTPPKLLKLKDVELQKLKEKLGHIKPAPVLQGNFVLTNKSSEESTRTPPHQMNVENTAIMKNVTHQTIMPHELHEINARAMLTILSNSNIVKDNVIPAPDNLEQINFDKHVTNGYLTNTACSNIQNAHELRDTRSELSKIVIPMKYGIAKNIQITRPLTDSSNMSKEQIRNLKPAINLHSETLQKQIAAINAENALLHTLPNSAQIDQRVPPLAARHIKRTVIPIPTHVAVTLAPSVGQAGVTPTAISGNTFVPKTGIWKRNRFYFKCKDCNSQHNFVSFMAHNKSNHPEKEKLECPLCGKYVVLSRFERHSYFHVRGYIACAVCGKKFLEYKNCETHVATHSNNLPFQCNLCPYRGRLKSSLSSHMKVHVPENKYACPNCPRTFKTASNLKSHSVMHKEHGFECEICKKKFRVKQSLQHHIQESHLDIRNHICKMCGKGFKISRQLRQHEINVHNRKKYKSGNFIHKLFQD